MSYSWKIVCNAIHDFSVWQRTGSNPAYINRFQSHTGKVLITQNQQQAIIFNQFCRIKFSTRGFLVKEVSGLFSLVLFAYSGKKEQKSVLFFKFLHWVDQGGRRHWTVTYTIPQRLIPLSFACLEIEKSLFGNTNFSNTG